MVERQVSAEVSPLVLEGEVLDVGDVIDALVIFYSAEITEERTYVGSWHTVQEPGDCEEYLEQKSSRKELVDNSNQKEA